MLTHYTNIRILAVSSALIGLCFALGAIALVTGWLPFESHANELQLLPAALVQLACAVALIWAGATLRAPRSSAFRGASVAHVGAMMGVLISMISFAMGVGKSGHAIVLYHLAMLLALVVNMAILWKERPRSLLDRDDHHHIGGARQY